MGEDTHLVGGRATRDLTPTKTTPMGCRGEQRGLLEVKVWCARIREMISDRRERRVLAYSWPVVRVVPQNGIVNGVKEMSDAKSIAYSRSPHHAS